LACTQPKELGYAAELWTRRTLAEHIRKVAEPSGHPGLAHAGNVTGRMKTSHLWAIQNQPL
jgi:hypothetical protein